MLNKNSLLFLLLITFLATSCTSNSKNVEYPQVDSKVLAGVWEYRNRVGGMMPYTVDEGKPGNGNLRTFT